MSILSNLDRRWFNPITIKTNFLIFIVLTLLLTLIACLIDAKVLPSFIKTFLSQSHSPLDAFIPSKIWIQLAVFLSLVLPIFALLLCWHKSIIRRMMLLYIVMLLVQIGTEITFSKLGLFEMNLIIGFTYTNYRVWQLWSYQGQISKHDKNSDIKQNLAMAVIVSGIIFWTLNWLKMMANIATRIFVIWHVSSLS